MGLDEADTTITLSPSCNAEYAVTKPEVPAPTTTTSAWIVSATSVMGSGGTSNSHF